MTIQDSTPADLSATDIVKYPLDDAESHFAYGIITAVYEDDGGNHVLEIQPLAAKTRVLSSKVTKIGTKMDDLSGRTIVDSGETYSATLKFYE